MDEEFETQEIDINEITLYPEMNKKILHVLMIRTNDIVSMYAAKLIMKYQSACCKTCKYHDEYSHCTSQKLTDTRSEPPDLEINIDDMMIYSYDEGGDFFTGDSFGCVHYAEKEGKDGRN